MSSTLIRRNLTTQLNKLVGYVTAIDPAVVKINDGGDPLTPDEIQELRRNRALMVAIFPRIAEREREWENLITRLEDQALVAEQAVYKGYQAGGKHFAEYVEDVRELVNKIDIALAELNEAQERGEDDSRAGDDRGLPRGRSRSPRRAKLPKLPPARFNGDPLSWQTFWQSFESCVHQQDITARDKMEYLRHALDDKVKKLINGLALTNDNYMIALRRLKKKYGDPKVITDALEAQLINLPKADNSIGSLQETSEAIDNVCQQMEQLGGDENQMLFIAKSKLPNHVLTKLVEKQRKWENKPENEGRRWSMKKFRETLQDYIAVAEEVGRHSKLIRQPNSSATNGDEPRRARGHVAKKPKVTRTFAINTRPAAESSRFERKAGKEKKPSSCLFCGGDHWMVDCNKVTRREDRVAKLTEMKRCFRCIRNGHTAKECRGKWKCRNCQSESHHVCICPNPKKSSSKNERNGRAARNDGDRNSGRRNGNPRNVNTSSVKVDSANERPTTLLMTRIQRVSGEGKSAEGLVFFDPGSQESFVKSDFAERIAAPGAGPEVLNSYYFGSKEPKRLNTSLHVLKLTRQDGGVEEIGAFSTDEMGSKFESAIMNRQEWAPNADVRRIEKEPDVLIGLLDFWRFFRGIDETSPEALVIHTTLGDVLCGRWPIDEWSSRIGRGIPRALIHAVSVTSRDLVPDLPEPQDLHDFWTLETIGIRDDPKENEDMAAVVAFKKTICRVDGRYRVSWPWRDENPDLPSNFGMALSRLGAILKKLQMDPELAVKYDARIREQLDDGIIEVADRNSGGLEHYLPHHPIVTHKLRIVYDASAHSQGTKSLNQCLYRGPVILPELVGLLIRFRLPAFPVLADIEKAFLQIELHEADRNVAKFLWVKDVTKLASKENLVVYRFRRVAFGVISSPFLLAATIQHHLTNYESPVAREVARDTYVDNILLQCESTKDALDKSSQARKIFEDAKMNLREFVSNAPGFKEKLPPDLRLETNEPKVLGIPWLLESDELRIRFPTQPLTTITRRTILQTLAGVFDPLGLLSPCLLPAKLLFQTLWEDKLEWDAATGDEKKAEWTAIENEWLTRIAVAPRRVYHRAGSETQLHVFVDASKDAYACCVYLLQDHVVALVYSKSRLRPRKQEVTIPRMELMAMLIGTRALTLVRKELYLPEMPQFLWGDSKVVLAWINSRDHQPRFVANRIAEIRKQDHVTFGYVRTHENPADVATRGCTPDELQADGLWWTGPTWLKASSDEWPTEVTVRVEVIEPTEQAVASFQVRVKPARRGRNEKSEETIDLSPWRTDQIGAWNRLLRTFAYVRRFTAAARGQPRKRERQLSPTELYEAERTVIVLAQREDIEREPKTGLRTVDDNGVVRLATRVTHSGLSHEEKNPALLPRDSHVAKLLIMHAHRKMLHQGVDSTLNEFLRRFWIAGARRLVKSTLKRCPACARTKGPSYALPPMPALPADRVTRRRPFESVGIDYLGPTIARGQRGIQKVWIVLITCLTTRAVFLRPAWDLSGEQFLHVFRRFIHTRGRPDRVLSDNGTQFRLAARLIAACTPLATITWKFIAQVSPWQGGIYERLVALVKNAFRTTLGRRVLSKEEMRTFVIETEAALNCRPLTYVSTEEDGLLPLRPADFINQYADFLMLPSFDEDKEPRDKKATELLRQWEAQQATQDYFWNRWAHEYLLMLREKAGWLHKGKKSEVTSLTHVGQVVLLEEPMKPRIQWSLARVEELETRAGNVRNVKLRMPNGHVWSRPLKLVYPLEASVEDENSHVGSQLDTPTDHVALTDHVAPDDHVAPNDHVAPADHVALTDHVAPNDHVAPTDHVALTDHVAPDDDVAAKGKRRKRPKPTANTHGMQTRFKAKTVAAVTFAVIVWFQSVLAQDCQIGCAPEGISVTTSERVVYALWCCERYSCQLIKGDTKGVFQLPMNVTGQQYGCNMACRGMVDIDPVQVVCSPWLPTEWPSWLRPTAISLLLLIIGILLGWKGGATWRAITNCCRRARLRLRAHQEDDEEGQELQLRENGPRVRFRPEETDGSIDKTRKDKTRKDTKGQTRKDAPEAAFVMTVPRRRESRQPPHIARWQKRQLVLRW